MFGNERAQVKGVVQHARTTTKVGGGGGSVGPHGGSVPSARSKELLMLSLLSSDGQTVAVELVGRKAYFRELPVSVGDDVAVDGIWKPRQGYVRALTLQNLTTGKAVQGRRWLTV